MRKMFASLQHRSAQVAFYRERIRALDPTRQFDPKARAREAGRRRDRQWAGNDGRWRE